MITDKYNDKKAVEYRDKLRKYYDDIQELEYRLYVLKKEAQTVVEDYNKFLGLEAPKNVQS